MSEHISCPNSALMSTYAGVATTREREHVRQYIKELRDALTAATQRAEAAEREVAALRTATAAVNVDRLFQERNQWQQRAEAAEAKLAAIPVEAIRLLLLPSEQPEIQDLAVTEVGLWLIERQSEVQP